MVVQVAEAGAALAVAVPPLLILLRLVARRRLLLRVQVVVKVVVRVKVSATRRLQVGNTKSGFRICQSSTCVNGLGGGFIFPFLWSDLQEINVRYIFCKFFVEIASSLFEILI